MPTVLALGEVLWDVFPDGAQFGGAPANFACAVASLGRPDFHVALASAVGEDDLGHRALQTLVDRNVDTRFVATIPDRLTGQVIVSPDERGQPTYRFMENPAWDAIPCPDTLQEFARTADAVCFGSLGQRSEKSRRTIRGLVQAAKPDALRVFDVNLRPPDWTPDRIRDSLTMANVVKLNDEELSIVADLLGLAGPAHDQLAAIITRFSLRAIALTRGAAGSRIVTADGQVFDGPAETVTVVDAVGAGDAYTAAIVLSLLRGWPVEQIGRWATAVSAYVCTQRGGTPIFPDALRTGMRLLPE